MARLGMPMGGRVRALRAVEDQSAPIPRDNEQAWKEHVYRSIRAIEDDQAILRGASGRKTRALMNVIVRQPRSLPSFAYQKMAEGARFENPEALETIDLNLVLSFQSQSLPEESEVGEEPVKPDRTR